MEPLTDHERSAVIELYTGRNSCERPEHYSALLTFYAEELLPWAPNDIRFQIDMPILDSHARLKQYILMLRATPSCTRQELEEAVYAEMDVESSQLDKDDKERLTRTMDQAIRTIIRVGFLLDCTLSDNFSRIRILRGYAPRWWNSDSSLEDFVTASIAEGDAGTLAPYKHKGYLSAWKLQERCGVQIRKTDNIAEHLLYEPETRILKVFHQVSYLRAQLQRYSTPIPDVSVANSLKIGSLPPQLILETIESFYGLLFPVVIARKTKSTIFLEQLVKEEHFDPQVLHDATAHHAWMPDDFQFRYWGSRLQDLYDLAIDPPPTSRLMGLLERYTRERAALIVAIIGLFLSALFGFLGVLVGIAQLWVSIDAWKRPAS